MALFGRRRKKIKPRTISIQSALPEGSRDSIIIESLLSGTRLNISIPGTTNAYTTYESQVYELYRKYNAFSSFGNQQTRAVIDLRTAFIAGEGISISCEDDVTSDWIENLIDKNMLQGANFINAVKGSELCGQSLYVIKVDKTVDDDFFTRFIRVPYICKSPYKPVWKDPYLRDEVIDIMIKKEGEWNAAGFSNFCYIRTGGDDGNTEGPVTRTGTVLTDIENYDRAIKDMRRNNHIFARITPVFNTESDAETKSLKSKLEQMRWVIGQAFIGKAKFKYENPGQGAHENLNTELVATIKTISSVTGVPVHWLGYVDLMSNRATAESLYELIKNATILERQIWEDSLFQMIIKAQTLYIDAGGRDLSGVNKDFEVRLPLIDFNEFLNRVKGLNLAYMDEAISIDDYRNALPGIDPLKTKRAIERENEEEKESLVTAGNNLPEENEEEE